MTPIMWFVLALVMFGLGFVTHWWCWALPRYRADEAECTAALAKERDYYDLLDAAYERQAEYLHSARERALEAERSLGYTLITQAAGDSADRVKTARMIRGRR